MRFLESGRTAFSVGVESHFDMYPRCVALLSFAVEYICILERISFELLGDPVQHLQHKVCADLPMSVACIFHAWIRTLSDYMVSG